LIKYNIT